MLPNFYLQSKDAGHTPSGNTVIDFSELSIHVMFNKLNKNICSETLASFRHLLVELSSAFKLSLWIQIITY